MSSLIGYSTGRRKARDEVVDPGKLPKKKGQGGQ